MVYGWSYEDGDYSRKDLLHNNCKFNSIVATENNEVYYAGAEQGRNIIVEKNTVDNQKTYQVENGTKITTLCLLNSLYNIPAI